MEAEGFTVLPKKAPKMCEKSVERGLTFLSKWRMQVTVLIFDSYRKEGRLMEKTLGP